MYNYYAILKEMIFSENFFSHKIACFFYFFNFDSPNRNHTFEYKICGTKRSIFKIKVKF